MGPLLELLILWCCYFCGCRHPRFEKVDQDDRIMLLATLHRTESGEYPPGKSFKLFEYQIQNSVVAYGI